MEGKLPDLYVISPFRDPVRNLKRLLQGRGGALRGVTGGGAWMESHVGTIHTFQGKEAEGVILLLGAGRGAKPGSRTWAGQTPNMLNVAATRAKRSLYVVGNRALWKGAGFFTDAADSLPEIDVEVWDRVQPLPRLG
ncbi:AAA domain-containing protein [Sphingomonas carotinifaciens]|uniref:AAA domain-containing protein n=1 Tax=Sphingomonas carotinifaciens TaxID=1166323 RepID=UPI0039A00CC6